MLGVCMREVRFGYTDRKILDSISFQAEQGKLLCVLGRNGVGKTTLFQLLLGSLKGYEGRIEVNGKSLEEYEEKEEKRGNEDVKKSIAMFAGSCNAADRLSDTVKSGTEYS